MPITLPIKGVSYDFIGWKDDHKSFYALDETRRKTVVEPQLPFLKNARWRDNFHFPKTPPTKIEKARLIPPPCRPTKESADLSRAGEDFTELLVGSWERLYGEVLYPVPEDDVQLSRRLDAFLAVQREALEEELSRLEERTDSEEDKQSQKRLILQAYHGGGPHALHLVGSLNVDLELVKSKNVASIRDKLLHEKWAKREGFDLVLMQSEKSRFLELAKASMVRGDVNSKLCRQDWISALSFASPDQMALLASVKWVLEFAGEQRFYLAGVELRQELTPKEVEGFAVLLSEQNGNAALTRKSEAMAATDDRERPIICNLLRKSGSVWKVVFEGGAEFHIQDTLGANSLLKYSRKI
ncbi:MAG: hypothetical protein HY043_07050 [Verrucomicrobia bacterium]|nr:hypothetical protein [Verrucomicrobiota bacterium]